MIVSHPSVSIDSQYNTFVNAKVSCYAKTYVNDIWIYYTSCIVSCNFIG
jgi:hypothetical protein